MKFTRKTFEIEATQWFPNRKIEGVSLCSDGDIEFGLMHTQSGAAMVNPGDWIITGITGEKYPCSPETFEKSYLPIVDET